MTASSLPEGHEIVKISDSEFSSLPLFLPSDLDYDPETNKVSPAAVSESAPTTTEQRPALRLVPHAGLELLEGLSKHLSGKHSSKTPVAAIACVGPYRTGKSLLLSRFLEPTAAEEESKTTTTPTAPAFEVGPTLEGCTRGIWIGTSAVLDRTNNVCKLILDCEGSGDPLAAGAQEADARIALACVLLATVFVFNHAGPPDRNALQFLGCLAAIRKRIPLPDDRAGIAFPSFLWVFRDFFLRLPPKPDGSGDAYTLEEYMLEKVLRPAAEGPGSPMSASSLGSTDAVVVESLLQDFASLRVLSMGYPTRKGGLPFSADEMATLGEVPWEDFDETFRNDTAAVVHHCLTEAAGPDHDDHTDKGWGRFFGSPSKKKKKKSEAAAVRASGGVYAQWCQTVEELINTEGAIPDLPGLQHRLLKQLADEQLAKSVAAYGAGLDEYLAACPHYNPTDQPTIGNPSFGPPVDPTKLVDDPKGIAEADDLVAEAIRLGEEGRGALMAAVASEPILAAVLEEFRTACEDPQHPASLLARATQQNHDLSTEACGTLATALYDPVQRTIRDDPSAVDAGAFPGILAGLLSDYDALARGPSRDTARAQHLSQPGEADLAFLGQLQEKQGLLDLALAHQQSLEEDIRKKQEHLSEMEQNLAETKERNQQELERLRADHTESMEKALAEQKQREQHEKELLEERLNARLSEAADTLAAKEEQRVIELEQLKQTSESRLQREVSAREDLLKTEQSNHKAELARLSAAADEQRALEAKAAADRFAAEQEALRQEMEAKLAAAERQLQEQTKAREDELEQAEKEMKKKEQEKEELQQRVELAESQACPSSCCCM